jgi:hypothetical protein
MTKYETVTTHQIRKGDLIATYGMRLRVDREPHQSKAHPVETDERGGAVMCARALIENWDELVERSKTDTRPVTTGRPSANTAHE